MSLVIPGVEVSVTKDVVAPQLAPSGVLGLIGLTEKTRDGAVSVLSTASFVEAFGRASLYAMPDAALALQNGVRELVVVAVKSSVSKAASVSVSDDKGGFKIEAKVAGTWANDLAVKLTKRIIPNAAAQAAADEEAIAKEKLAKEAETKAAAARAAAKAAADKAAGITEPVAKAAADKDAAAKATAKAAAEKLAAEAKKAAEDAALAAKKIPAILLDIAVSRGGKAVENLRGLDVEKIDELLGAQSELLTATKLAQTPKAAAAAGNGAETVILIGGTDASKDDYAKALVLLESEPDVDMVLAAVQDFSNAQAVADIYGDVIAHCARMSAKARGRIGFGQVPHFAAATSTAAQWAESAPQFFSDRFVLLAPNGVAGAVAGMIGSLEYFQSPTFKAIAGVTEPSRKLLAEEQEKLLLAHIVPVATMRGRGTVVVRGLTTDGDQISVRRAADHAVRGVQMIGELFIGRLNNETGRGALREKLVEFLMQMEKEGAIVPSTDRRDPAFKVNVYSSQDDFAKGIVRIDMAVRPVRAIDYIYATVLVQA